jgi:hypothetical protein
LCKKTVDTTKILGVSKSTCDLSGLLQADTYNVRYVYKTNIQKNLAFHELRYQFYKPLSVFTLCMVINNCFKKTVK